MEKVGKIAGRAACQSKGLYKDESFPWKKKKKGKKRCLESSTVTHGKERNATDATLEQ